MSASVAGFLSQHWNLRYDLVTMLVNDNRPGGLTVLAFHYTGATFLTPIAAAVFARQMFLAFATWAFDCFHLLFNPNYPVSDPSRQVPPS